MLESYKRPLLYLLLGVVMAVMPISEEPHLVQKVKLLLAGHLYGLMDWFDLVLHGGPLLFALLFLIYTMLSKKSPEP